MIRGMRPRSHSRRLGCALAALSLAAACSRPVDSAVDPTPGGRLPESAAVLAMLTERARALPHAGIVAGLLDASGRRFLAAGTRGGPGAPPPDARSVFEIGSVTKVFTATLLAEMAGRGEVRLDEPVAELLPASVRVPSRGGRAITLVDLATQSSGLPRLPGNLAPRDDANPYADYTEAQLFAFLASYQLPRAPGAEYEYSNLGVGLLGLALARRAGTSYERLVAERILAPLGLRDTRIALSPDQRARLVPGHDETGAAVSNWDVPTLAGAGALRSTAEDLIAFLAANLAAARGKGGPLARAMRQAHAPRRPTASPGMSIGLGWHVVDASRVVWHNGGTGGYHSFVGFAPDRGVGVVLLTNSTLSVDEVGMRLLDPATAHRMH
jgi:D-alanyl-D-alanine-carboxypeptidase/D-alanyl-D-alanine-endopeptidase